MQSMTDRNITADKKIGIFGGAFNPVHNGHLKLARFYYETLGLDKVIFIPTASPPHKSSVCLASKQDRLNMLELALGDTAYFEISDAEFKREGKSYTAETLDWLRKAYPSAEFYLIIGADQFLSFSSWYRYRDILSSVTVCTSAREDDMQRQELISYANKLDGLDMNKFFLADYPVLKVSSSEIREMIKRGENPSDFLPERVYKYISEKELYIV